MTDGIITRMSNGKPAGLGLNKVSPSADKSIKERVILDLEDIITEERLMAWKEAIDQARKGELEWLEICYKRFPHNFVKERILWLKEKKA